MKNSLSHIAFIMDGNNRWSSKNNINKFESYEKGAKNLINLSKYLFEKKNIKIITAFALSSNNLKRSKKILDIIIKILDINLDRALNEKFNFSILVKGDLNFLNNNLKKKIKLINNHNLSSSRKLIILINYSGKQDIVNSLNQIKLNKAKIDINSLNKYLVLSDLPDPELLIRTGGFQRISDFLLYNLSFTELFFTKKLWPDLKNKDLDKIIYKFEKIERKFGL